MFLTGSCIELLAPAGSAILIGGSNFRRQGFSARSSSLPFEGYTWSVISSISASCPSMVSSFCHMFLPP
jgi:hypothetical protein